MIESKKYMLLNRSQKHHQLLNTKNQHHLFTEPLKCSDRNITITGKVSIHTKVLKCQPLIANIISHLHLHLPRHLITMLC